jgi:SAM-dependent methyltransferase
MKFFDKKKQQIIHTGKTPDFIFWDNIWKKEVISAESIRGINKTIVSKITRKYLSPEDGIIFEGGCGPGGNVMSLKKAGFNAIGLDFAVDTVKWVNNNIPELNIELGDVRKLPYENGKFIGYWSMGLIEHFQTGYLEIVSEMYRVIKKGGYLFLSFPYMSLLRKIKAKLNKYEEWQGNDDVSDFYEYFLNPETVISDMEKKGFKLIRQYPLNPIKGTKDEIALVRSLFQKLHNNKNDVFITKIIRKMIAMILLPVAGHSLLLVMKKK